MIARAIAKKMNVPDEMIIKAGLEHDLDEVMTGDIPSPIKQKMIEKGFHPNSLEKKKDRGKLVNDIIKTADFMESVWFLQENGQGRHAKQVESWLRERFEDHKKGMTEKLLNASRHVWVEMAKGEYTI